MGWGAMAGDAGPGLLWGPPVGSARRGRPPRVEIKATEGLAVGEVQVMPMGDPHLRQMEQWDHVVTRDEDAVEGTHGGREVLGRTRLQQGLDHGVGRRVLDARIVERALDVSSLAAPAVDLLIAGRQGGAPR